MVAALLSAAGQKQAHPLLCGQCLQLAIRRGQQGDWDCCLGALRLSRVLGATPQALSAADASALGGLRARAAADNGGAALLFCEALGHLLPASSA